MLGIGRRWGYRWLSLHGDLLLWVGALRGLLVGTLLKVALWCGRLLVRPLLRITLGGRLLLVGLLRRRPLLRVSCWRRWLPICPGRRGTWWYLP